MKKSLDVQNLYIHTKESRTALTRMVIRLFDHWQISIPDQAALLYRSLSTLSRYRNGGSFADVKEMHDRVSNLLVIHKCMCIIFPHNRDLVYSWVTARNQAFEGQKPLDVMKKGLGGIIMVRSYLELILQK